MAFLVPTNPIITTERADDGTVAKLCIDGKTENVLQRQRIVAMSLSPILLYAGYKMKDSPWYVRSLVAGMGLACFYSHLTAYRAVHPHMKKQK